MQQHAIASMLADQVATAPVADQTAVLTRAVDAADPLAQAKLLDELISQPKYEAARAESNDWKPSPPAVDAIYRTLVFGLVALGIIGLFSATILAFSDKAEAAWPVVTAVIGAIAGMLVPRSASGGTTT